MCRIPLATEPLLPVGAAVAVSGGSAAPVALTVYGCDPHEARMFRALAPRFGVVPSWTTVPPTLLGSAVVPAPGSRCVSVGHRTTVPAPVLHALRGAGVEHLSTRSVGVDHIDLAAAREVGITVESTAYSPDGVADFTLMLLLMALRGAKRSVLADTAAGIPLLGERGRELRDLTVGVVGVGRIGSAVVERLRGFGCRVLAHDRAAGPVAGRTPVDGVPVERVPLEPFARESVERVPLDRLLRESDVVTLHVPLSDDTRHLLDRERIAAMRPGAVLVNTARGALVDTAALVDALESGRLGGAALDVLEHEERRFAADRPADPVPDPLLDRLRALPTAIVTPHTAYYTEGALRDTVELTLAQCRRFEEGRADG